MLTCDISCIASVLFAHVLKLRDSGNPPLLSPTRFERLAHTSSRNFTIQVRVPVYIPKTEFYIEHRTPDLRIGTANIVVIRQGSRRENIFAYLFCFAAIYYTQRRDKLVGNLVIFSMNDKIIIMKMINLIFV